MSPQLQAVLAAAEREGLLRPLDVAFAAYLARAADRSTVVAGDAVLLLAALTSSQHGQGHLRLDLDLLWREPARLGLDSPAGQAVMALLSAGGELPARLLASGLVADAALPASASLTTPLVFDAGGLYLRRAWRDEVLVAEDLRGRMQAPPLLAATVDLRPVLARLFPARSDTVDWQKLACALAARQRFTVITGGPGTGKTTTVVRLLGLLQSLALAEHGQPLRIALAAPTGKAAARLNESIAGAVAALPLDEPVRAAIPTRVSTVHRLLGAQGESRRFRHDARQPLVLDVLVIDEASMLDLELMAAVLRALPAQARLILLGDREQLASVEAGAVLGDLCAGAAAGGYEPVLASWLSEQTGAVLTAWTAAAGQAQALDQHVVMLRESHRFDAGRGIGRLARLLQEGRAGDLDDFSGFAPEVNVVTRAALLDGYEAYWQVVQQVPAITADAAEQERWALAALTAFDQFRILCAIREGAEGVAGLNADCEARQRQLGRLQGHATWYAGRPVMVTRNDYALGLMNGDIGITLWQPDASVPEGRRLRVVFRAGSGDAAVGDSGLRWLLPSRLPAVATVYAMTVHKAQGSEFTRAALVLPAHPLPVLTRELVYTALTRARAAVDLLPGAPALWRTAVSRQAIRSSGLAHRLQLIT